MSLSKELQIGKVGEHLVCADLILQGYNAFLADQGLPFDVLVEQEGNLKRIQVKTTTKLINTKKEHDIYRFGLRRGRHLNRRIDIGNLDYVAFVALDIMKIAYIPISLLATEGGKMKQCMEFKSERKPYYKRQGNYRRQKAYFESYNQFGGDATGLRGDRV